jgi:translation initiation factor IF-2
MHPTSRMPRVGPGVGPGLPPPGVPAGPAPGRRPHKAAYRGRDKDAEHESKVLRRGAQAKAQVAEEPPPISREITISEGITIKELSEKLGVKAGVVIKKLVDKGVFVTINQTLDAKTVTELARLFGASIATVSYEEEAMQEVELTEDVKDQQTRAPVVTIMGHVDHGKTSLLDSIRASNVAGREAGGITQAIGAYQVEHNGRKVVFIDTPGHEAFTRMRSRGAKVTDLVILVVAADDGVMPQTLEAIDHARAAKVPILVAINKIDKPDAQPERVKQQLADRGLLAEDWGGETVMVPVSAKTKTNLDLLLEMVLLLADMQDLKSNPGRPGMGTVLEAKLDRGQGPVATVLIQNGTLRVGDFFIVGSVFGKVRALFNDLGETLREAPPATPVVVLGMEELPSPGDSFQVVTDTAKAKQIVGFREARARESAMAKSSRMTLEHLHEQMRSGEVKELPIILKADVTGSVEVLTDTLEKLSNEKVKMRIIRSGVGAISESDVLLATTSDAIIVGFNVRPERSAAALAEREGVDIRLHTIIYEVTDEIKRAMLGLLEPVIKESPLGKAEVREVFRIPKVGVVAGCFVQDGKLSRDCEVRLLRDNVVVYTGKVSSLRRFKDDVGEVKSGFECGVSLSNYSDVKQGDVIEAFVTERIAAEVFA